jgi:hypothetical protein
MGEESFIGFLSGVRVLGVGRSLGRVTEPPSRELPEGT